MLTKPESMSNAYCQANAETTVMIAYGMRIAVAQTGRDACSALCMTMREREAEDQLDRPP